MIKYKMIIYWSETDNAYRVEIPELVGCMAEGATYQKAVKNAEIVIKEWLETTKGKDIPQPKGMKILKEHLKNNQASLKQYSNSIIKNAKHTVNLGTAREQLISNFLQQNLPEYIRYHTGEIFDSKENRSGQIDIVLHPITSPKMNLFGSINLFPVETVLSAIEIKSNLTKNDLYKALESCKKVKKLEMQKEKPVNTSLDFGNKIPFIIFSYKGLQLKTLIKHLANYQKLNCNLQEMPDLIIVLDEGYYLQKSTSWMNAGTTIENLYEETIDKECTILGMYDFILKLVEYWASNPCVHTMPVEKYTKKIRTLRDFFSK